jgi:thiamine-monophosphate kinase
VNETEIIRKLFSPLAATEGAFGLRDDAALLPAGDYVVTKDLMVAGVHFLESDPPDLVARKLLRVNLSDLAAKGARPVGYFLGCVWPAKIKRETIARFAEGLTVDQETFRISLYGGDTARHVAPDAPLMLSVTMFGAPPRQEFVRRSGASPGDDLYVTGTIGDAGLGLAALRKELACAKAAKEFFVERYRLPTPRLTMGGALSGLASAALDVSDGLIVDAGRLAEAGGLAAEIQTAAIPLSAPGADWLSGEDDPHAAYARLATAGDDYEILFAAPPTRRRAVEMAAKVSKTPVARIGQLAKGEGVRLVSQDGEEIDTGAGGYDHFAS